MMAVPPAAFAESDPRVTRVGSFLRSTSLDEIPQSDRDEWVAGLAGTAVE